MRASGPVAIRTGTLIRKTGCRGPLGTAAARHVIRWNRKALLVEDLLHQVGGGLGECELAEARVDGGEVGVDDLVESVVLHDVSFRSAWRRSCFLFFPLAAAVSLLLFGYVQRGWRCRFPACGVRLRFSLRFLPHRVSLFCCAFIIGRLNRRCHATIVDSFVFSSANLEINVTML